MSDRQVKIGIVLSYLLILTNTMFGFLVTPYMIGRLGESEYGVYKTISSLSSALMVLDFGIGSTVMRFVAKFRASEETDCIPNYIAMSLLQATAMSGLVLIIGVAVFFSIKPMYAATFSSVELSEAQLLFCILLFNMILHVFENVVNGIITGSNRFIFGNGIKVIRLILRTAMIVCILTVYASAIALALIDLFITIVTTIAEYIYTTRTLKIKPRYSRWDRSLFLESGKYMLLMFLTSVAVQINNNLDNVIIGAISGPALVTVYSMGLLIFGMYESLSTSLSGVMLPTVTDLLERDEDGKKIQSLIVKVGRIQFLLLGAVAAGFACIGKHFINIWLGKGYEDVYIISLILMIPSLFELCVNVCLAILRAKNKLVFRTCTLCISTLLNAVVTILAVKYWSYIGAAVGTALSFIIGSVLVMNLFYYKKMHLPMIRIYGEIMRGILPCLITSGAVLFVVSRYIVGGWLALAINIAIFCIVYGILLMLFGLSTEEKRKVKICR